MRVERKHWCHYGDPDDYQLGDPADDCGPTGRRTVYPDFVEQDRHKPQSAHPECNVCGGYGFFLTEDPRTRFKHDVRICPCRGCDWDRPPPNPDPDCRRCKGSGTYYWQGDYEKFRNCGCRKGGST